MQKPFIKVQIKGMYSLKAAMKPDKWLFEDQVKDKWLTFIAFSKEMKTQVLDFMAANQNITVQLSIVDEPTEGEWYED